MHNLGKTIANNALAAMTARAPSNVVSAIKQASAKSGVNFAYMVQQAAAESSFNPAAKAKTSSASGLYQFIESTWMNMVERYGAKHGIVTEGKTREEILRLRNDPKIASNMAAEFAAENERHLDNNWGGDVGPTELYFAHFMGAGGASAFLNARDKNPMQEAALLFPKAAAANRNVFYDRETGRAKTLEEVHAFFDKKFAIKDDSALMKDVELAEIEPTADDAAPPGTLTAEQVFRPAHRASLVFQRAEKTPQIANDTFNPYQALINNPIELMLLAQLEMPFGSSHSKSKI